MLTLFDYPASENAWKIRQLLHHLQRPYRTVDVSIFEGEGRTAQRGFLAAMHPYSDDPFSINELP